MVTSEKYNVSLRSSRNSLAATLSFEPSPSSAPGIWKQTFLYRRSYNLQCDRLDEFSQSFEHLVQLALAKNLTYSQPSGVIRFEFVK